MVTSSNSAPTPTAHPAITPQVLGVPGVMGASMTRSGEGVGVGPQMAEVWGREEVHRGNGQGHATQSREVVREKGCLLALDLGSLFNSWEES